MALYSKSGTSFLFDDDGNIAGVKDPDGSEQGLVTYNPTTATIPPGPGRDAVNEAAMPTIITVSTSRALTAADNGKVLRCSSAVTLEYPEGLGAEFSCIVESPASGDVTIDPTGSCTANGGSTSLTRSRANNPAGFVIRALAANVFGVSGA